MRRLLVLLGVALAAAGCGGGSGGGAPDAGTAATVERTTRVEVTKPATSGAFDAEAIFRRVGPGVVEVISIFDQGGSLGSGQTPSGGIGSGFVLDDRGEIATNAHVVTTGQGKAIKRAQQVYVKFPDDNQVAAKIVGYDPNADVALLRLDTLRGLTLRPLPLGRDRDVRVGAPVVAIGSPFGEEQSLSVGVVSALDRAIQSLTSFETLGAVQTDAAINQGNSGGPLIDERGRVIGINAQIRTNSGGGEGVGYAIPVDQVRRSTDQLRRNGRVRYAYLGVSTTPVYPQLGERFRLGTDDGAWVQEVVGGGPADQAGLRAGKGEERFQARAYAPGGDVIVEVGGQAVRDENDLGRALTRYQPGDRVALVVVRDGQRRTVQVELGERPAEVKEP